MAQAIRLRQAGAIRQVFDHGQRYRGRGLSLWVRQRAAGDRAPTRRAICPTRGFRSAVARNRCKRICREAYRRYVDVVLQGHDLVFTVSPGDRPLEARISQMGELLGRAGLVGARDGLAISKQRPAERPIQRQ